MAGAGERGTDQGKPDAGQGRPGGGTGDQQHYRDARQNQGGPITPADPGKPEVRQYASGMTFRRHGKDAGERLW